MDPIRQTQLLNTIHEVRLLIFFETKPQSNKYHQVMISYPQYNAINNIISTPAPSQANDLPGMQFRDVDISNEVYDLPDLQTINIFN